MKGGLFLFVALCVLYVVHAIPVANYDDKVYGSVRYSTEVSDDSPRTPIYATLGVTYPPPKYQGAFDKLRKVLQEENTQLHSIVRRDVPAVKNSENVPSIPEGIIDPEQKVIHPESPATSEYDDNSEDTFPYQRVVVGVSRPAASELKASQNKQDSIAVTSSAYNGAPREGFPIPSEWIRHNNLIDDNSSAADGAAKAAADSKNEASEVFTIPPEWIIYNSPSAVKSSEPASYSSEEDDHSNSRSNRGRALHFTTSLNIPSFPNGINTALPSLPKLPSSSSLPSFPSLPSLPGVSSIPSSVDEMRKRGRKFIDSFIQNDRVIIPNFTQPPTRDKKCVHKLTLTGDNFVIDGHIYFSSHCQQPGDNDEARPPADNAWRPNLPGFNGSPTFPGTNPLPAFPGGMVGYPTPAYPGIPRYPGMHPLPPYGGQMPGIRGMIPMRPGAFPGFGNGHGIGGFPFGPGRLGFGRSFEGGENTHGTQVPTEETDDNVTPTTAANEEPHTQESKSTSTKSQENQEKDSRERSIKIGPLKFGLGIGDRM